MDFMAFAIEKYASAASVSHQRYLVLFNPPRHMRLLEVVHGPSTRPDVIESIEMFCDFLMGKRIVRCKDTPGFIANRIGIFWMQTGVNEAIERGVSVEEADALMSRPVGIPKTGVFGLWDLVGIDLSPHIISSMLGNLGPNDPYQKLADLPAVVREMIDAGYTGRKGKGGYYSVRTADGAKVTEVKDLISGQYRPQQSVALESLKGKSLRDILTCPDRGGQYLWAVLSQVLAYTASLVPEICDDIVGVDDAMKLGYAWTEGPFELIDRLGAKWFSDRLRSEGRAVPELIEKVGDGTLYQIINGIREYFGVDGAYHPVRRAEGVILLEDIKQRSVPIAANTAASLWDIGDGVACLEFHTKMNAVNLDVMAMIDKSCEIVETRFKGLVIYNEGRAFSAGADLSAVQALAEQGRTEDIRQFVKKGQATYQHLKFSPFPVVGAVTGLALGGGCEVLLHCDAIRAHAEANMGLVEIGVGLVPAWGGCKELLLRWNRRLNDPKEAARRAFLTVFGAAVSKSAAEAQDLGFLARESPITMNRDRLLSDAKTDVLHLAEAYRVPTPSSITPSGTENCVELSALAKDAVISGRSSSYDAVVGKAIACILSAGDTEDIDESGLLELEQSYFDGLIHNPETLARIGHMLKTGKTLRN